MYSEYLKIQYYSILSYIFNVAPLNITNNKYKKKDEGKNSRTLKKFFFICSSWFNMKTSNHLIFCGVPQRSILELHMMYADDIYSFYVL